MVCFFNAIRGMAVGLALIDDELNFFGEDVKEFAAVELLLNYSFY